MRHGHLGCVERTNRGRFFYFLGGAKAPPAVPYLRNRRQKATDRGKFSRGTEQLRAMKVALRSHVAALAFVLCGIVAVIWVLEAFTVALHNSQDNDWGPARALLHGLDPYKLYLRCTSCPKSPFLPPVAPMYPASGLILLWPFAMLPWPAAKVTWAILNLTFGAGLIVTLYRLFLPDGGWRYAILAFIALFAGAPFLTNVEIGQHAVFALGWFVAALWADRKGNTALASVFLAVSWFKYTLTFPLSLLFVVRFRWTPVLAAAVIHVVLTIFAAVWTGSSPLDLLLEPLLVVQVVHRAGHLDVFGLAMRLGLGSKLVPLVAACTLTVAVLLAALRSRAQTDLTLLCLFSLFAYIVVYHLAYDLVVLIIPLFYVLSRMQVWSEVDVLDRIWTIMLAVLLGWTWFADRLVQTMKTQHIEWVMHAYPTYYAATAVWFYATTLIGILALGTRLAIPLERLPGAAGVIN